MLFSIYSHTEPLKHVITVRGQILVSRTGDDPLCARVSIQSVPVCTFKTSPCVPAPCAHVETHVCAWCLHTRGRFERDTRARFEWTHGHRHTPRPQPHTHTHSTTTTTATTTHHRHHIRSHFGSRRHRCAGVAPWVVVSVGTLKCIHFIGFAQRLFRCSNVLSSYVCLLLVAVGWNWRCVRYGR